MTSLFGNLNDRWPLSRAVDAMVSAARRTGFPALIWLVGVVYPGLTLGLGLLGPILALIETATGLELQAARDLHLAPSVSSPTVLSILNPTLGTPVFIALLAGLPVSLIVARFCIGLARVSEEEHWLEVAGTRRTPTLWGVWRAGAGLTLSALGLLLSFPLLLMAAVLFLLGPVILLLTLIEPLRQFQNFIVALVIPVGLATLTYAVVLQVLVQLSLHSLARNRRGSASALTHAWRMVRNSPWSAARAMLVDLLLQISLLAAIIALDKLFQGPGNALSWIMLGFVGATRASYWAETYEGLGGLSTVHEPVPGSSAVRPG